MAEALGLIDDGVTSEEFQKFQKHYNDQLKLGAVLPRTKFEYAWCLVRSSKDSDIKQGNVLLEELYHGSGDDHERRDYLYYLAVGNMKIKEYQKALKYAKAIQTVEPNNTQAKQLQEMIESKMKRDGLVGMAIVGGSALALTGLLGVGVALLGIGLARRR